MFLENNTKSPEQIGSIKVICGSMFSGKTEELIRLVKKSRASKMKTIVFKPFIDNRYSNKMVVSHSKSKIEATLIKTSEDIMRFCDGYDVIAIDEVQFFDQGIVKTCNELANQGFQIILAGLDMDFKGNPFGPMPNLMAIAEYVTKLHAVCNRSGSLAQFTFRKNKNLDQIFIGENDQYEALSRNAFQDALKKEF